MQSLSVPPPIYVSFPFVLLVDAFLEYIISEEVRSFSNAIGDSASANTETHSKVLVKCKRANLNVSFGAIIP